MIGGSGHSQSGKHKKWNTGTTLSISIRNHLNKIASEDDDVKNDIQMAHSTEPKGCHIRIRYQRAMAIWNLYQAIKVDKNSETLSEVLESVSFSDVAAAFLGHSTFYGWYKPLLQIALCSSGKGYLEGTNESGAMVFWGEKRNGESYSAQDVKKALRLAGQRLKDAGLSTDLDDEEKFSAMGKRKIDNAEAEGEFVKAKKKRKVVQKKGKGKAKEVVSSSEDGSGEESENASRKDAVVTRSKRK